MAKTTKRNTFVWGDQIRIKLYGMATCSRCKMAKMMLERRNINFAYTELTQEHADEFKEDLPELSLNGKTYRGKDALLQIRKLKK